MPINVFTRYPVPQPPDGGYSELIDCSVSDIISENTFVIPDAATLQGVFKYVRSRTSPHNLHTAPGPEDITRLASDYFSGAMQGGHITFHAQYDLQGFQGPTNLPDGYLKKLNSEEAVLYIPGLEECKLGSADPATGEMVRAEDTLGLQPFVGRRIHEATFSTLEHPEKPGFRYYMVNRGKYAHLPVFEGDINHLGIYARLGSDRAALAEHFTAYYGRLFGWSLTQTHALHPEASLDRKVAEAWIQGLIQTTAYAETDSEEKKRTARERYATFKDIQDQIEFDWPAYKATRAANPVVIEERQASAQLLRQWRASPHISVAVERDPDRIYGSFAHHITLSNTVSLG